MAAPHESEAKFLEEMARRVPPSTTGRIKWNNTAQRNIQVGDMVLLMDDITPALQWPTGRITAILQGTIVQCVWLA